MNEIEYILRIVLKARDELAGALKAAREQLRLFANAADSNKSKIDGFNDSIEKMDKNVANITNKFKEWRAVIQGAADDNDDTKKSFGDLGREVDSTQKRTTTALRTQKEYTEQSRKLRQELRELEKAHKEEGVSTEYALSQYKRLGRELENLSQKITSNTERSRRAFNWSRQAKEAADGIIAESKRITKDAEDQAKLRVKAAEDEARAKEQAHQDALRDLKSFVDAEIKEHKRGQQVSAQIGRDEERDRKRRIAEETADMARASQERVRIAKAESDAVTATARATEANRRLTARRPKLDDTLVSDAKFAAAELKRLSREFNHSEEQSRHYRVESDKLSNTLRRVQKDTANTQGIFGSLRKELRSNSDSLSTIDNQFRGLGLLAVIGFANQLITVLGGLAGGFVAVAASAAQAGAAIGGMFVAGVGQALPSIGLLGAALVRVKSVMDVIKQARTTEQQQAVQSAGASRRVADATDAITGAQNRLRDASEGLTKARREARRDLQDLIQAEKDAALAAAGAALSQKEAQQALISAQARGDVAGIQRAQLAVLQAQADAEENIAKRRRARQDAERGRGRGVEGSEGVVQAKRQVADAQRGIETARRNAKEAQQGTITAAAQLNYLLAQLSPAERRLYTALTNIQNAYRRTYRPITDLIINSFTRSVQGVEKIMLMPEVIRLATRTARQIARQLNRIFDSFTTGPVIDQLLRIGEAGRKNLKPLTDIVISLGHSLVNIAEGAGPAFSDFLEFVRDLADQFERLTGNRKDLEDYFKAGEEQFEAWIKLGLAVINLFLALSGAGGAETGKTMIEDTTTAIDDLTQKVDDNKEKVKNFFGDAKDVVYDVVGVVEALAVELGKSFDEEHVSNFAAFLREQVIPVLGDVITALGWITDKLVDFGRTPIGGEIIKATIFLLIFSRVLSGVLGSVKLLTGFLTPVARVLGTIASRAGLFARLGEALVRFGPLAGRFLGIVGAVIALLHWLGLLDDAWRAVRGGFEAFYKEVAPSLRRLFRAFKELWDAVSEGKGLFAAIRAVLRPLVRILIEIGGIFLRVFGRALGRIIGGAIDILTGIITFLTGVFTGDWRKAWSGIRQIFRGFIRGFTALFRVIPELIGDIAKKIAPAFRKGIESLWDFLRKLPDRLGHLGSEGAKAFVKAFKGVGKDVISGIVGGLRDLGGFAKDIANAFIDLLNKLLPNKLSVPGAPDINLPNNPIPHLAAGGPVPGTGIGDRVHALLEPGEHVWTRGEVQRAGGHAAMYAMRRYFGGGGQGTGGRYQEGGAAGAGAGSLTINFQGGNLDAFRSSWRAFWLSLLSSARTGANLIETQFRQMRVNTARSADRMYRDVRGSIADIQNSFKVRGARIVESWADMWMSLKKVTAEGLFYIGHETNKALTSLGERHIAFGFTAPKKTDVGGKAGGGWIGNKGQRGADMGFYPLGAGEAVLNWQHQNYVEPAMNAYYGHGLDTMFNRVHGQHAGGGGTGFASGRPPQFAPIPGMPGEEANTRVIPLLVKLIKQYHAIVTDAYDRDHSAGHKSPGHNITGTAADMVPGPGGSWNTIEAMGRWAVGQGMTVGYGAGVPGSQAWPGHGRGNHIHIELGSNPSAAGAFLAEIAKIGRPLITGGGKLAELSQAAIDMVLKAANRTLSETFEPVSDATTFKLGPGGPAQKVFDFFTGRGLSDAIAAGFVGTFQKESGFNTTITNAAGSGATGLAQWLGGRLAALKSRPNWQSLQTQLNFVWDELHGSESAAFSAIKGARTPEEAAQIIDSQYERSDNILSAPSNARQAYNKFHGSGKRREFAEGGIIPGPEGAPVPILAHAQEWVLNGGQVSHIAHMLGVTRAGLRSMMGFYGGPGGFQGGGEPVDTTSITPLTARQVRGIDDRRLRRLVRALRLIGENIDKAAVGIGSVESWSRYIDNSMTALRRVTRRVERRGRRQNIERGALGFLDAMEKLTGEGGVFAKLRESIERRAARFARRLITDRLARVGGVVSERFGEQEQARRELREQRRQGRDVRGERADIAGALRLTRRQLRRRGLSDDARERLRTQRAALRAQLEEADQRVADSISSIYEAQQAYADAQVQTQQDFADAINKRFEAAAANLDLWRRVATAVGNEGAIDKLNQAMRQQLTAQANELEARIAPARAAGAGELADQLAAQVADLRVQIFESIQQELRDAMDRINTRAQRRLGRLDLGNRLLDAVGAVGLGSAATLAGERFTRGGLFAQRGQALEAQRAGLQGVLRGAQAQGNIALIQDLTDQLAELDVTIKENTKAAFDAKTEAINNRASLTIQQSDLRAQIIALTGEISGNTDQAALLREAQAKATALEEQRTGLLAQLAIAQQAGNTAAVNDLTTQLLENQLAILQNTQATTQLTGQLSGDQGFTSTAFEIFSQAIFTGSGGLLPMYQALFPSAQVGANVLADGMLMAHSGEKIVPAKVAALSGGGSMGDTNYFDIDINEAGRPIDWAGAATQIMFKKSGAK